MLVKIISPQIHKPFEGKGVLYLQPWDLLFLEATGLRVWLL